MADGQIAKGAMTSGFKGATLGAKLGSVVPGVGTAIGAGVGAVVGGAAGGIKAKKDQDRREAGLGLPALEDPTQTARMLEVDRIAKNIQAGTDPATERALASGADTTAATQNRLARLTGGASGATVDAMLKSQRAGQTAANQAVAQGQSRLPFFMNLGQQIANRAEQRKLELELLDRAQTSAETAQEDKERNVNFDAGLASGVLGSNLGDISSAPGRIKSLLGNMFGGDGADAGTGADFVNPNANLDQINISPENANPSVDLGSPNFGTEVPLNGGANMGTFGALSGSTGGVALAG